MALGWKKRISIKAKNNHETRNVLAFALGHRETLLGKRYLYSYQLYGDGRSEF